VASTVTVQDVLNFCRTFPDVHPVLGGTSGYTNLFALTVANDTMQFFLAQNFNWKFNRGLVPSFLTVGLQQDYVQNVTDLGWLEQAWRVDINNSVNNGNTAPKPVFAMETVRDLQQTSWQANPFNISWIPNTLAQMGKWQPNTSYLPGYGQAQVPITPLMQFIDANGNILFINSNSLGLSINSPGFTGTPLNTTPPYGVSGSVQPAAAPNAAPGTTVVDGTVTWTVADPNGYAMRVSPLPAYSGLTWLIFPYYQRKAPKITSLSQTISPIPDDYAYLYRQGFLCQCFKHAGSPRFQQEYAQWQADIQTALRASDRERDETCFYPTSGLMSGNSIEFGPLPIGPAWPFQYFPY
jgi:hypothetical protein